MWENDVRKLLGIMKVQNWSKVAMAKEAWKRTVEQVVAPRQENLLLVHKGR
jgi:hypothetical protein